MKGIVISFFAFICVSSLYMHQSNGSAIPNPPRQPFPSEERIKRQVDNGFQWNLGNPWLSENNNNNNNNNNFNDNNNQDRPNRQQNVTPGTTTTTQSPALAQCIAQCTTRTINNYNPVCGSDGVTYPNEFKLNCARECGIDVVLVRGGTCAPL